MTTVSQAALIDTLIEAEGLSELPDRVEALHLAAKFGATEAQLRKLAGAARVHMGRGICLDAGRYENMSRGKGWARQGKGKAAIWGERRSGGYWVTEPGRWVVGSDDGYNRKDSTTWDVEFLATADQTWTIAN